jgi:hypothetical protein
LQQIANIVWQWSDLVETMPASQSVVPDPQNYTLTFLPDGTVSIKADCNMLGGTYTLDGGSLAIQLGPSTMAFAASSRWISSTWPSWARPTTPAWRANASPCTWPATRG